MTTAFSAPSCLDLLHLNDPQKAAATASGDLVVAAGAGAGKTRALVGRYLALLESGIPLREIVAITFTDKAAREMRTRIRQTITERLAQDAPRRASGEWEEVFAGLDAARIGTIHSLCAQVLREHPVEAAQLDVMPGFTVLEEGQAAVLRARAVEGALAWAVTDAATSHLFGALGELGLRRAVSILLEKRLDVDAAFERLGEDPLSAWSFALREWLDDTLDNARWRGPLDVLAALRADDPADKMELARQEVLAHAAEAAATRQRGDYDATLAALAALYRATALVGRKANWPGDTLESAKAAMRELRGYFDDCLSPLADPDNAASWVLDEQVAEMIPPIRGICREAVDIYAQARRARNALDFDDLEAGAAALLDLPAIRAAWQASIRAVLVDEFQDTNDRQRRIIYALTGFDPAQRSPGTPAVALRQPVGFAGEGRLWVVGDGKQSIYRFRGADVTVFRSVQDDVGRTCTLDLTFRAHTALVETTNRLLDPILGELVRPDRPYAVPFAPLIAHRSDPRAGIAAPFVEFHLGLGEPAEAGRQAAADGLAARLHELRDREGVAWQDVALLFRASSAFAVYEDALERAGIPFVTVAGRGFYDRPEVRTLMNALLALADPGDDLAMVGFLRSPLVGLTDAGLYLLRFPPRSAVTRDPGRSCSLWPILNHPALSEIVPPDDLPRALRGRDLLADLHTLAGRVRVATLLKQLLDQSHYRALLQVAEGGARLQRNVDKLLADAQASGIVSVREFVEYVRTLRDVGARESEAPTEAGSAVQLMTVHKAKGLEFPVVVIADAAHAGHRAMPQIRLDDQLGVTVDLRNRGDMSQHPAAHQLAALRSAERDAAEDRRLLYVAATRAQEKLLVSAHTRLLKGGKLSTSGWLDLLARVTGLDQVALPEAPAEMATLTPPHCQDVGCRLYPLSVQGYAQPDGSFAAGEASPGPREVSHDLVAPRAATPPPGTDVKLREREAQPPRRVWRVVPRTERSGAPAWVVGTLVHAALRHWRFEDRGLDAFLRPFALEMGVVDEAQIRAAIAGAGRMLRRFRAHPLWAELDSAQRWHELSFSIIEGERMEHGIIDLLYRTADGWKIAEFKTDRLSPAADLPLHIRTQGYDEQVQRYVRALRSQLGTEAQGMFIFLNVGNELVTIPASSS